MINMDKDLDPKLQLFNLITNNFDEVLENYNLFKHLEFKQGMKIRNYKVHLLNENI